MDIKSVATTAKMVIESLVVLVDGEGVDIESIKMDINGGNQKLDFKKLIDLALSELELIQVGGAQVQESNALLSAAVDAVEKLGSGDFVLVPKEPTLEMCHRGRNTRSFKVQDIYKAMIEVQEQKA